MNKDLRFFQLCCMDTQTEKAIRVEGKWFPKSQCIIVNNLDKSNNTVYVPVWLFLKDSDNTNTFGYKSNSWTLDELLEEYKYNQLHNGSGIKIWDCEIVYKNEVILNTENIA